MISNSLDSHHTAVLICLRIFVDLLSPAGTLSADTRRCPSGHASSLHFLARIVELQFTSPSGRSKGLSFNYSICSTCQHTQSCSENVTKTVSTGGLRKDNSFVLQLEKTSDVPRTPRAPGPALAGRGYEWLLHVTPYRNFNTPEGFL